MLFSPNYLQFHHLPVAEAFVIAGVTVHTAAVSFSSLQHCKAWSHLALDRGACHPHTVIIPELTSPLSIELLRRWRGHKIPCSERQHCSRPSGLGVKNPKWTLLHRNRPPVLSLRCLTASLGHLKSYQSIL